MPVSGPSSLAASRPQPVSRPTLERARVTAAVIALSLVLMITLSSSGRTTPGTPPAAAHAVRRRAPVDLDRRRRPLTPRAPLASSESKSRTRTTTRRGSRGITRRAPRTVPERARSERASPGASRSNLEVTAPSRHKPAQRGAPHARGDHANGGELRRASITGRDGRGRSERRSAQLGSRRVPRSPPRAATERGDGQRPGERRRRDRRRALPGSATAAAILPGAPRVQASSTTRPPSSPSSTGASTRRRLPRRVAPLRPPDPARRRERRRRGAPGGPVVLPMGAE